MDNSSVLIFEKVLISEQVVQMDHSVPVEQLFWAYVNQTESELAQFSESLNIEILLSDSFKEILFDELAEFHITDSGDQFTQELVSNNNSDFIEKTNFIEDLKIAIARSERKELKSFLSSLEDKSNEISEEDISLAIKRTERNEIKNQLKEIESSTQNEKFSKLKLVMGIAAVVVIVLLPMYFLNTNSESGSPQIVEDKKEKDDPVTDDKDTLDSIIIPNYNIDLALKEVKEHSYSEKVRKEESYGYSQSEINISVIIRDYSVVLDSLQFYRNELKQIYESVGVGGSRRVIEPKTQVLEEDLKELNNLISEYKDKDATYIFSKSKPRLVFQTTSGIRKGDLKIIQYSDGNRFYLNLGEFFYELKNNDTFNKLNSNKVNDEFLIDELREISE